MKRKIWKQVLALVLAVGMIVGDSTVGFALESQAAESEDIIADSGTCGEDATWSYEDGVLEIEGTGAVKDYTENSETPWYQYKSDVKKVIIGNEITSVGTYICHGFTEIEEIVLGAAVTKVGKYAFAGSKPKKITVPNQEFTWGTYAFSIISYSSEVHDYFITLSIRKDATSFNFYNSDVEAIQMIDALDETAPVYFAASDGVLYNSDYSTLLYYPQRRQDKEYTVNEKTKNIDIAAFYESYYIEKITLPEGIETIPEGAFSWCESLKEINIPDTVKEIGIEAFSWCGSLKEIEIPDKVTKIEESTFAECYSLENVTIGDGVTEIGMGAFNCCYGIKTLKFGRNVANIGEAAFSHTSLVGPVSLDAISEDKISGFSDTETPIIEEMLIPVKEVTMAEDSFEGVDARKVQLYSDTALSEGSVFLEFASTEAFEVIGLSKEDATAGYGERDGVLFDTEYEEIVSYPKGKKDTEYRIADGITDIWAYAFNNADYLEKLYIPNSVEYIGADAFSECDNLTIYCDEDSYAAQYAEENNIPYSTEENNIEFTLLKKYSVGQGEEPIICDDQISDYDVVVTKDDVKITGYKVNRNNITLPPEQVGAGDVIKISLTSKEGEALDYTTEITLNENCYAKEEFEVLQKGRFSATPIVTGAASVIVFDSEGNRIESDSYTNGSYISEFYDTGRYQVMFIYGEERNWPYDTLEEFVANGLKGNYTLKTVQIEDNIVTNLGEISVTEYTDIISAAYLDESCCYMANTEVLSQNGLLQVKAVYKFKGTEETISPIKIRFKIPNNCAYINESLKMNGEQVVPGSYTGSELILWIDEPEGTITFNLEPLFYGTGQSQAVLSFSTGKRTFDVTLGKFEITTPYISLTTPSKTSAEKIQVSGITVPEAEVIIYDGEYKIGTVKSSKAGRWSKTVTLVNPENGSVHDIKAVIHAGTEEEKQSNTVKVLYDSNALRVVEFKAYYRNGYESMEMDLLNESQKKLKISYDPRVSIKFTVKLSDNERAEAVYIVSIKRGNEEELIETWYNEKKDCWVAQESFANATPGILSVRVIEKSSDLKVDKDAEFSINAPNAADELKNSEYEEIVNEYDQESGLGNYEGILTLNDEEKTAVGIQIAGRELEKNTITTEELLNDGYIKTESADGSSEYYSKIKMLENGNFELETVEVKFEGSNVVTGLVQQLVTMKSGDFINKVFIEAGMDIAQGYGDDWVSKIKVARATENMGEIFGENLGILVDGATYFKDLTAEDGTYNRINHAYEKFTDAYTNNQMSAQEYSEKLEELKSLNEALMLYQSMKLVVMGVSTIGSYFIPGWGLLFALISGLATGAMYEYCDSIFDAAFVDLYCVDLGWTIDPSGYVYEAIPDNRLEDVTATIYYQEQDADGNISAVCWDAEEYDQINPLITDEDGVYAWDVPEGYWKVVFTKEGYETAETEWLPVPPIQTDVNIGMVSKEAAIAEKVTIYHEYALLTFDKYIKADSITSETVKITSEDQTEYGFTLEPVGGVTQDDTTLALQYKLKFDEKLPAGVYSVKVDESVKDYADRNLQESYTFTEEVKSAVTGIKIELPKEVVMGEEVTIPVTIITEGNPEDYEIACISDAENMAEVSEVSKIDENGTFYIKVDPKLPGQVTIDVCIDRAVAEQISLDIQINPTPIVPEIPENDEVVRLSGATRYETGYKVADALKEKLGVDKFDAVVVATGKNFADALAGSYLAVQKNAPIILTNGKDDNVATLHDYIKANVIAGGKVYILGGEAAVPASVEAIDEYEIVRLSGKSRYETNLAILEEAGIEGNEVIVATGKSFADSLSASAAKLPILLVKPGASLNEEQKAIAETANGGKIYIIGGEGAVSAEIAEELKVYAEVVRVSGKTRYETSVAVANTFFGDVEEAVVASGKNFPDGLCGGPLAAAMDAPLILTADGKTDAAVEYVQGGNVESGFVLGGTGALTDESVVDVFALESTEEIIMK